MRPPSPQSSGRLGRSPQALRSAKPLSRSTGNSWSSTASGTSISRAWGSAAPLSTFGVANGAGKTTLVDLVAGLLAPETGLIEIDGKPLVGQVRERWRAAIAYVGQEGSVFSDSVRGNLLAEGARADDVDLWQVLETVGLGPRVRAFAAGLNESVGDRGSQLSGGERQRLALARALLRRPSLLILDEATAALDPESEALLIERLKAIEPRPAALIVAHRESTLSHCDSVVVIQHGVVTTAE